MKARILMVVIMVALAGFLKAQNPTPVKWTFKAVPLGKGEYMLTYTATIDEGWHTYSQFIGEGGPVPTAVKYNDGNREVHLEKPAEKGGKVVDGHDEVFDMQLKYFENTMVIEQKVKVLKNTTLKGTIESMACNNNSCLPPTGQDFVFTLNTDGK